MSRKAAATTWTYWNGVERVAINLLMIGLILTLSLSKQLCKEPISIATDDYLVESKLPAFGALFINSSNTEKSKV